MIPALLVAAATLLSCGTWELRRIPAARRRDGAFLRHDLLVVAPGQAQGEFQPGIGCKAWPGAVGKAAAGAHSKMVITEISSRSGRRHARGPAVHIRASDGCNLRCTWCDTAYAFHGGKKMSVEEVLSRVDELADAAKKCGARKLRFRWSN